MRETQEAHRKLQEYVEDITLRIINKNPALLEKHWLEERNRSTKFQGVVDFFKKKAGLAKKSPQKSAGGT